MIHTLDPVTRNTSAVSKNCIIRDITPYSMLTDVSAEQARNRSRTSACYLLHACIFFDPEDGGDIFVRNFLDFKRTTWRIPEDRTLHNHCCENLKSHTHGFILSAVSDEINSDSFYVILSGTVSSETLLRVEQLLVKWSRMIRCVTGNPLILSEDSRHLYRVSKGLTNW
jgi:hypothetical protein